MTEQRIQQQIRLACGTGDTRLFRNNTGTLRDQHGRPVTFGLTKGSADLIGWTTRTITPEMVGHTVAQFCAVEVKTPTGKPTAQQMQFLEAVAAAGGVAVIARGEGALP